jgi:hypothetical protein
LLHVVDRATHHCRLVALHANVASSETTDRNAALSRLHGRCMALGFWGLRGGCSWRG